MIVTRALRKVFGTTVAVESLDLSVRPGEIYGFIGPNGAGKTTTIRMLAGILKPTGGEILIAGVDMKKDPVPAKKRIGYIPDRPYLYDRLTAVEFLSFVASVRGMNSRDVKKRTWDLLDQFGLSPYRDDLVESFSHGMKQRLVLASALLHSPSVLVVDEPMVGLDPRGTIMVKELFKKLRDAGTTIFLSTHTLSTAQELCDRISIIHRGHVVAEGSVEDLREMVRSPSASLEAIFLTLTEEESA